MTMKINDEDVERDWKPGDKAFIEVEVLGVDRGFAAVDTHDGPGYRACATVRADRLRPVPAAGEAETECNCYLAMTDEDPDDWHSEGCPNFRARVAGTTDTERQD